ncbi:MAG: hypothetical protein ACI9HK_003701 [Pirellulaceae bacterium]|jgi:hypothetical protein
MSVENDETALVSPIETEMFLANWPLRDESPGSWVLATLCIAGPLVMGALCENLLVGGIGAVVICLVFWRLFTPVSFLLGPNGIMETAMGRSRKSSWRQYATFMRKPNGVLLVPLSPDGNPPVMRGTYIYAGRRREQLIELLGVHLTETGTGRTESGS